MSETMSESVVIGWLCNCGSTIELERDHCHRCGRDKPRICSDWHPVLVPVDGSDRCRNCMQPMRAHAAGSFGIVIQHATDELTAVCKGKRWTMSIPVGEDDTDIVIGRALNVARHLMVLAAGGPR